MPVVDSRVTSLAKMIGEDAEYELRLEYATSTLQRAYEWDSAVEQEQERHTSLLGFR